MSNGIKDLPQSLISSVRETLSKKEDLYQEDLKRRYPFAFPKTEDKKNLDENDAMKRTNTELHDNTDSVIVERRVRKGKNNVWKIDSWTNEEEYQAKKAPRVDFAYSQSDYNNLMNGFKKQGRFWEETEVVVDGEINENSNDLKKAASEISKIDSKVGSIVARGNFPSSKDLKKLDSDARDDVYMIMAKYVDPDVIANKYGVDLDEARVLGRGMSDEIR